MNKGSFLRTRRFRYGSMSAVITALVVAAVILLNVIVSALATRYLWYIDMTREGLYSVSDECFELLDNTFESVNARRAEEGEGKVAVTIKFCDEYDNLMSGTYSKYVLSTALELADRYPEISVEYINIYDNPSAVNPYKTSISTSITNTSVIVTSGSEYRLYALTSFFLTSSGENDPWAYFGEKRLASAILAVTKAEMPSACVLMGHGEKFYDASFISLVELAGFRIDVVSDLISYEIPDDCRLMICYNPTSDFRAYEDGISDISEIEILDKFLEGNNHSLMVFMSPESPVLPNLEEYLKLWGIKFDRDPDAGSYVISESGANALTSNGTTFLAQYETGGYGASLTSELRSAVYPKKIVFKNAMSVSYSDVYERAFEVEEESGQKLNYAYKGLGAYNRQIWRVFSTGADAVAMAGGKEVAKASSTETFGLMTLSMRHKLEQEDNYGASFADESSYVLACGSTDFATEKLLSSNVYGNNEVLMRALFIMGKEAVPTSLTFIPFVDQTIDTLTTSRANTYTALLAIIPAAVVFIAGVYVIVRRKNQ